MEQKNSSRSVMEKSLIYLLLKFSTFKGLSLEASNVFLYKDVDFLYCSIWFNVIIAYHTYDFEGQGLETSHLYVNNS